MNKFADIFYLLTNTIVDHPYLVEYSSTALARSGTTNEIGYVEQPCDLCHDPVEYPACYFLLTRGCNITSYAGSFLRIERFVIENAIEERILELQEKKKLVFEGLCFFGLLSEGKSSGCGLTAISVKAPSPDRDLVLSSSSSYSEAFEET